MNVAFIPVRGGSKSIPLKNIKKICGRPLVYWTVKAASSCGYVDKVYVSTDSDVIKETVEAFSREDDVFSKVEVIGRSKESASDTASTESAMLEFAEKYDFDNIVLVQATSPLLTGDDLERGFEKFNSPDTDSVLSVVKQKRFHWDENEEGIAYPTNYDVFNRPRRQEFKGYYVENGAFYITSKKLLLSSRNRVSGNIRLVEMSEDSFFEIDEPSDWIIIEALMRRNGLAPVVGLKNIKLFLTDCDGCLTDGGMYYSEKGDELKKFNTRDGVAFGLLRKKGILTGIVTGENVELNKRRVEKLKLDYYAPGCGDKLGYVKEVCSKLGISLDEVAYVGDDLIDIPLLKEVGLSCCPSDASKKVKEIVNYVSPVKGGDGVIRDVVDMLLDGAE